MLQLSNTFYMALQTDIKYPVLILLLSPEIAVFFVTFLSHSCTLYS